MNKIRLTFGEYKAITDVTLSLFCGEQEREYRVVKSGQRFCVPAMASPFGFFATYHPDFGDSEPQFERLEESVAR